MDHLPEKFMKNIQKMTPKNPETVAGAQTLKHTQWQATRWMATPTIEKTRLITVHHKLKQRLQEILYLLFVLYFE